MPRRPRHLTIKEKRDFFATIARDSTGEYSTSDKFKAIIEDTKLLELEKAETAAEEAAAKTKILARGIPEELLQFLPPPLTNDEQSEL